MWGGGIGLAALLPGVVVEINLREPPSPATCQGSRSAPLRTAPLPASCSAGGWPPLPGGEEGACASDQQRCPGSTGSLVPGDPKPGGAGPRGGGLASGHRPGALGGSEFDPPAWRGGLHTYGRGWTTLRLSGGQDRELQGAALRPTRVMSGEQKHLHAPHSRSVRFPALNAGPGETGYATWMSPALLPARLMLKVASLSQAFATIKDEKKHSGKRWGS